MKIFTWNDIQNYLNTGLQDDFFENGTGLSIGCFDGIHKGHRVLLNTLIDNCKKNNIKSGVVTFTRPLPSIKHSDDYTGDVSSLKCRLAIFESIGLDFAIIVDFDEEFSSQLGADFLNILVNACNMELLAEGVDFRCGYKGATDAQAIKYFGLQNEVKTIFVEPVFYREGTEEEERISSSYIRNMISKGFFATVSELLERNYELDISDCDVELAGKKKLIARGQINQALPPNGIYRVLDNKNNDLRLEITDDNLIFKPLEKSDYNVTKMIFK